MTVVGALVVVDAATEAGAVVTTVLAATLALVVWVGFSVFEQAVRLTAIPKASRGKEVFFIAGILNGADLLSCIVS
jgi:hypothetical protein